jgi:hypothetical protein
MNNIVNHLSIIVFVLGLAACQSSPSKPSTAGLKDTFDAPEWITNVPEQKGIAYGTGSADFWGDKSDAIRRAGEAARVNLVSQLRVTISGNSSADIQERKATGKETELVQTMRNTIRSSVPAVELDEVKITESYVEGKYAYALAELDRQQASSRIGQQIRSLEDQIIAIDKRPREGSTLEQVRVLLPALQIFAQRERLADQLALVSMQRQKPALTDPLATIQRQIYSLFDTLKIKMSMTDSGAQEIAAGVIEALTEQGMRISYQGQYDLLIEVSVVLRPIEKQGLHYVFADSRVTIKDNASRILSTFSRQAKGASGHAELAQTKAEKNVASMLATELANALVDRIN